MVTPDGVGRNPSRDLFITGAGPIVRNEISV
jgi:hypothetical protein